MLTNVNQREYDCPMPRTPSKLPELASLAGAGQIIGVSKQYVHRLAARGELVGARLDGTGSWVFVKRYIQDYAASQGKAPVEPGPRDTE
jgi:hypothetical protein